MPDYTRNDKNISLHKKFLYNNIYFYHVGSPRDILTFEKQNEKHKRYKIIQNLSLIHIYFTGPIALRHSISTTLPDLRFLLDLYKENYTLMV